MAERTVESVAREIRAAIEQNFENRFSPQAVRWFAIYVLRCERRAAREALEAAAKMLESDASATTAGRITAVWLRRLAATEVSDADEG